MNAPTVTLHEFSDATRNALRARAARHGRSVEAEILGILEAAVLPVDRVRLGSAMSAVSRSVGLTNADVELVENVLIDRWKSGP